MNALGCCSWHRWGGTRRLALSWPVSGGQTLLSASGTWCPAHSTHATASLLPTTPRSSVSLAAAPQAESSSKISRTLCVMMPSGVSAKSCGQVLFFCYSHFEACVNDSFANNDVCMCSAETQDDRGRWVPCAVKRQPYFESHIMENVDKEVVVLKAMTGSAHALTLMSHGTALLEGKTHKYIATRSAPYSCMLSVCHAQC